MSVMLMVGIVLCGSFSAVAFFFGVMILTEASKGKGWGVLIWLIGFVLGVMTPILSFAGEAPIGQVFLGGCMSMLAGVMFVVSIFVFGSKV